MLTYEALPMAWKTLIAAQLFLTLAAGVCICILCVSRQSRAMRFMLVLSTVIAAVFLLLYVSVIPAERAKPYIPGIVRWFSQQPVLIPMLVWTAIVIFFVNVISDEVKRRKTLITASSIKESFDHLRTGLCFAYPNGLVLLTNHRMNELCHGILGRPLQNADLFWQTLTAGEPVQGVRRIAAGAQPEFSLQDGTVWTFKREEMKGVVQITAADTTRQHQLLHELQDKHRELEDMNTRIRSYGDKVDEYVIARERLETRVNLHGFLGQALLMTRHYLQYEDGDPKKIVDIWQRNIDVLRLEAEPQPETDSMASLKNAARAIGMQVHVQGQLPQQGQIRRLIAALGAEALTNAVRHAGARQLWIDVEETEAAYVIRYTNDGAAPAGAVTEGGGLSTARRKIEAAGGRMRIETAPRFVLTMTFAKEVTLDV